MEKNKSNNSAVRIVFGILTAIGLVLCIISLIQGTTVSWTVMNVLDIALAILICYYGLSGYKKPHGNLLKYIILIYAATYLVFIYQMALDGSALWAVIYAIVIGMLCYLAGRLARSFQNFAFMYIITAIILFTLIISFLKGAPSLGIFTWLIIWIDICVAYFVRYKDHKSAGQMDK